MDSRASTARPLLWSLLLHVGLLSGLLLMAMPCARFEAFFETTGLPTWLNPVQCRKPLVPPGPVIQATLVGPVAAPVPEDQPEKQPPPPPPEPAEEPEPATTPEQAKVKTLPSPPDRPALKDQEEVVAIADQKAEQARHKQQEKEQQRQSELQVDKLLARLDKLKQQSSEAARESRQAAEELENMTEDKARPVPEETPEAPERRTGGGGEQAGLLQEYAAALTRTITRNWLRPDNIPPGSVCPIHIEQIPGGQVISVRVLPSCPFDDAARRSVKNAVLRAQPLPYAGYKSVFRRDITLNFKVLE